MHILHGPFSMRLLHVIDPRARNVCDEIAWRMGALVHDHDLSVRAELSVVFVLDVQ